MQIFVKKIDNRIYFKLIGELDDRSGGYVREKLDKVIDREEFSSIVFDMKGLTFMDSTGIGVIIGRYKRLKPMGKEIYVINTNSQIDKIMRTCGLYQIVKKIG